MNVSSLYHNTRPEGELLPQEAAAFAGSQEAAGGILIRPTNLEDVVIELTGHKGGL